MARHPRAPLPRPVCLPGHGFMPLTSGVYVSPRVTVVSVPADKQQLSLYRTRQSVNPRPSPATLRTGQTRGLQADNLHVLNVQDGHWSHSAACYQRPGPVKTLYQS